MKTVRPIVITGFMGCGKTELARKLAVRMGRNIADLDDAITQLEGRSPARLIQEEGEKAFRKLETNALRGVLRRDSSPIVALGGGAWIEDVNRELIKRHRGISVWLDTSFEVCWERIVASGDDRPLGRTIAQARELFEQREPIYQLAQIRLQPLPNESADSLASRVETAVTNL
jgi:shikimate kinase